MARRPPLSVNSSRTSVLMGQFLVAVAVLALWQLLSRQNSQIPSVPAVGVSLVDVLATRETWVALAETLSTWSLGLLLSAVLGTAAGFLMAATDFGYRSMHFTVDFFRSIPAVALLPVALLIFGTRPSMKVTLILFACVWIMLVQAAYGLRGVDQTAKETLLTYRLRRRERLLFLTLPSAAPYLMAGLRVAATMALLIAVGAEMVTSAPGLGREIVLAGAGGDTAQLFALALIAGLLGVLVHFGSGGIERFVIRWQPSARVAQP